MPRLMGEEGSIPIPISAYAWACAWACAWDRETGETAPLGTALAPLRGLLPREPLLGAPLLRPSPLSKVPLEGAPPLGQGAPFRAPVLVSALAGAVVRAALLRGVCGSSAEGLRAAVDQGGVPALNPPPPAAAIMLI